MEKHQFVKHPGEADPLPQPRGRYLFHSSRRILAALLIIISAGSIFLRFRPESFNIVGFLNGGGAGTYDASVCPHSAISSDDSTSTYMSGTAETSSNRVPFEAHIMSKCPDAQYCLQHLVVPAMEQIHDKVDFRLSFIGRSNPPSPAKSVSA
jgi:hypothetical protein